MRTLLQSLLCVLSVIAPVSAFAEEEPAAIDIPKLADVVIDGKPDEWAGKGLKLEKFPDPAGKSAAEASFKPVINVGWDDRGILVLAQVTDDVAYEPAEKVEELWKGDSLEIFVGTKRGVTANYQVVIGPGRGAAGKKIRSNISDYRKDLQGKKEKLAVEAASTFTDTGYIVEVLLPWKNLNITPAEGLEVGMQIYANDSDKADDRFQGLWYPKPDAHLDAFNMNRIKLVAPKADAPK